MLTLSAATGATVADVITNQVTPMVTFVWEQLPKVGNWIATDGIAGLTIGFLVIGGVFGLFMRGIHR